MVDITISDFMKGTYNLIIYVGIDIAKLIHCASAISFDYTVLIKAFKYTSNGDSFPMLHLSYEDDIIIVLESTAQYDGNFVRCLVTSKYNVCFS